MYEYNKFYARTTQIHSIENFHTNFGIPINYALFKMCFMSYMTVQVNELYVYISLYGGIRYFNLTKYDNLNFI